MQTVHLNYPIDQSRLNNTPIVLVLGYFDGVHLGHQRVINIAKEIAIEKKYPLVVMSFEKSPALLFNPNADERCITPLREKQTIFEQLGVDIFYVMDFDSTFSQLSPQKFVDEVIKKMSARVVVAGFDYKYGHKASGDMTLLQQQGQGSFEVISVDCQTIGKQTEKISSTKIRDLLQLGAIDQVNELLGRKYQVRGTVVHGFKRGRKIGYPTANVSVSSDTFLPGDGVYVVDITVGDVTYPAMASVGKNITFHEEIPVTLEVNIFDFERLIYDEDVTVRWYKRLRDEIKFDSIDSLVEQLSIDENNARHYFKMKK